jgi:hypothetical protein
MLKKSIATLTAAMALTVVCVPVAAADDPNQTQYGNPAASLPNEPTVLVKAANDQAPPVAQGTLPFTGLDISIALAVGVAAVAGGLGLRRLGRVER